MHWESGEEAGLRTRIARSCLAFVLALLPLLLGLVLFLSLPRTDPYLVLVDAHGPGQDRVEVALVGARALHTPSDLTALDARSLQARIFCKFYKKKIRLVLDCSLFGNLSGALYVVNTSNPECPSSIDSVIKDEVNISNKV